MEHIFFEVQLCIEMLIFKEKHVFPILIILCLATSLHSQKLHPCGPRQGGMKSRKWFSPVIVSCSDSAKAVKDSVQETLTEPATQNPNPERINTLIQIGPQRG